MSKQKCFRIPYETEAFDFKGNKQLEDFIWNLIFV